MQILILTGAAIVLLLGVAHAVLTLQSRPSGGPLTPTDTTVTAAMQRPGGLGLAPDYETTLWRAWVGFNLSHAIGVIVAALVLAVPVIDDFDAALDHPGWLALAFALPPLYLILSIRHWFDAPTRGIAVATVLILAGTIGGLLT